MKFRIPATRYTRAVAFHADRNQAFVMVCAPSHASGIGEPYVRCVGYRFVTEWHPADKHGHGFYMRKGGFAIAIGH